MAHSKSAKKRIRQQEKRRVENKYFAKTTRNAIRDIRAVTTKSEGETQLPKVNSLIDRLAKKNIIHRKKASNLKSKLTKFVNSL